MARRLIGTLFLVAVFGQFPVGQIQPRYDLLIAGGQVVDGTGAPARRADVAIRAGRIVEIGTLAKLYARDVIDATGLVVAPGFIDVHTHADDLAEQPRAENFVRMGVTTIVAGNCGSSALDVGKALTEIEQAGASVNFATLIGHNTVRRAVMGTADRIPTIPELDRDEVARLAGDGGRRGRILDRSAVRARHLREDRRDHRAGARRRQRRRPLRVAHAQRRDRARGGGRGDDSRRRDDRGARADLPPEGRQPEPVGRQRARRWRSSTPRGSAGRIVQADQYAYTAASSTLGIRFPAWALEGGQAQIAAAAERRRPRGRKSRRRCAALLAERGLADLSFAVVASYRADPSLNGLSMKQVAARLKGSESADAQFEAARDMMLAGGASMVYHFMSDDDVERIMRHPQVGIASDSSVLTMGEGVPHPRGYGNNARVLAEYVRARKVIPLEEAVRKMTSLPAEHFRFADRGRIAEGYAADIVSSIAATVARRGDVREAPRLRARHPVCPGERRARDPARDGRARRRCDRPSRRYAVGLMMARSHGSVTREEQRVSQRTERADEAARESLQRVQRSRTSSHPPRRSRSRRREHEPDAEPISGRQHPALREHA